jgi:hypothetical protein
MHSRTSWDPVSGEESVNYLERDIKIHKKDLQDKARIFLGGVQDGGLLISL